MFIRNAVTLIARVGEYNGRKQFVPLTTSEFGEVIEGMGSIFVGRFEIEGEVGNYAVLTGAIAFGMRQNRNLSKDGGGAAWHETTRVRVSEVEYFDTLQEASETLKALTGGVEDAIV